MLKVVGMDGSPAWVNPAAIQMITAVRGEDGVVMIGCCAVHILGQAPIVTRVGADELAAQVNGGSKLKLV